MSEFKQESFIGGMNLLADDTRLPSNQYRIGFNVRNRYDVLQTVPIGVKDTAAPTGIKQELTTFGNFIVLFVAGYAYYRHYTATGWTQIPGFKMSIDAPRYWTCVIPLATTNYGRIAPPITDTTGAPITGTSNAQQSIKLTPISDAAASAFAGNDPGLLVQDNLNQPQFIYIDPNTGYPTVRTTQTYAQWYIHYTTDLVIDVDRREYVPIGNTMAWVDGVLYITSQDFNFIYRSVSGRPLDFVVNVGTDGGPGGDATTTSYSVGVGGISCLRQMSTSGLFVSASNANFIVSKNTENNAPKLFGEYTFIRTFLFNATCLSDRVIFDTLGDTRFIDLTGVRSFNAIEQEQNEGRNSVFTNTIAKAFQNIVQDPRAAAGILYDNYELYGVNTIFGPAIAVYDTLSKCWSSFDLSQTGGSKIKIFAKIELTIQRLYAVTEDNELYTLYAGTTNALSSIRTPSACSNNVKDERGYNIGNKMELKLQEVRCIVNEVTENMSVSITPFINNRLTSSREQTKEITYNEPTIPYTGGLDLPDVDTQLFNLLFTFPNCGQGWKTFLVISWTSDAVLTQYSMQFSEFKPMNPLLSQGNTK